MIRLLTRYLYRQTFAGMVLAASVVGALIFVVDFVEISRSMDALDAVTTGDILRLALMKMPALIEQTLPFMVLFGVMWALFRLNRRGELVAMRAATMSAWNFALPALVMASLAGVLAAAALNPVASRLSARFASERMKLLDQGVDPSDKVDTTAWFREATDEGIVVIRAGNVIARSMMLYDLTFYYYTKEADGTPVVTHRIDAQKAQLKPGFWQLFDARDISIDKAPKVYDTLALPTRIAPSALLQNGNTAASLSIYALPKMIEQSRQAGFDTRRYRLQLQKMLALPLMLAAMAIIGAAFSFSFVRLGGALRLALLAGGTGFALYFSSDLLQTMGVGAVLPPFVAAWAAPVFVFFAGLARITMLEDG